MGGNFEHTQIMATEALGLHLWGMEKDGDFIPEPTQPPFNDTPVGSIVVPVTVFPEVVKNEMDNRSVKTNITLRSLEMIMMKEMTKLNDQWQF